MANFNYQDLERLSREMASLTRANLPLPDGLRKMAQSFAPGRLRALYHALGQSLNSGVSLSNAIQQQKAPPAYVAAIRCAEAAGDLPSVLAFSIEHCRRMNRHLTSVRNALLYPCIALAAAAGILLLLSHTAIPALRKTLEQYYLFPPFPGMAFSLGRLLGSPAGTVLAAGAIIILCAIPFLRITEGLIPAVFGRLPLFRPLIAASDMALLMRFLAAMMERGVPLPVSLRAAALSAWTPAMRRTLYDMAQAAERGQRVGPLLARTAPPVAAYLFQQAEERGDLADACRGIADYLEDRFDALYQQVSEILEPMVIIFLGIFIAAVVITLYTPFFDIPRIIK